MDINSFHGYCKKYKISASISKKILKAFQTEKPSLVNVPITNNWQKEPDFGYIFNVDGIGSVCIELGNMLHHSMNNVTYIKFGDR